VFNSCHNEYQDQTLQISAILHKSFNLLWSLTELDIL